MRKREITLDTFWLLLALLILFVALFPYWIFGSASAMGWYDETDALIPWNLMKARAHTADGFLFGYAGGTGSRFGFLSGNERISLYRFLLQHLPVWVANLSLRLGGMVFLFSGVYAFCRKVLDHQSRFLCFSVGLFAVLGSYVPYGWTLGGYGWDFGVIVWLAFCLFTDSSDLRAYSAALGISLIAAVVSGPVFLLPSAMQIFVFFALMLSTTHKPGSKRALRWLIVWGIFGALMTLNWGTALRHAVVEAGAFSARFQGTLSEARVNPQSIGTVKAIFSVLQQDIQDFLSFMRREPSPLLWAIYALTVAFALRTKAIRELALLLGLIFLLPVGLDILSKVFLRSSLGAFRWSALWTPVPLVSGLFLAYLSKREPLARARPTFMLAALVLGLGLWGAKELCAETLAYLSETSGCGAISHLETLEKLADTQGKFRVLSAGRVGSLPLFYGLDTFDGMLMNFPFRRNYFIAFALSDPPVEHLHTHRHFFYDFPHGIDLRMLRLVNVRYVVADHEIVDARLKLLSQAGPVWANDRGYAFKQLLHASFSNLRLVSPLYIYDFGNVSPRVYAIERLRASAHSFSDQDFYRELKAITDTEALIAKEDQGAAIRDWSGPGRLSILSYSMDTRSVRVQLSPEGGVVVLNQVYTDDWRASCGQQTLPLVPVNGIMMAALVPTGCHEIRFYFSPR